MELLTQFHFDQTESPETSTVWFNDWICGIGLIFLDSWKTPLPIIFKLENTVLGDTIQAGQLVSEEADKRGVLHRHKIEKLASQVAGRFTTSSVTVARQARQHLSRKPNHTMALSAPTTAEPATGPK